MHVIARLPQGHKVKKVKEKAKKRETTFFLDPLEAKTSKLKPNTLGHSSSVPSLGKKT